MAQRGGEEIHCFSFAEMCKAQEQLDEESAVSPLDPVAIPIVTSHDDGWMLWALSIINVAHAWKVIPIVWILWCQSISLAKTNMTLMGTDRAHSSLVCASYMTP